MNVITQVLEHNCSQLKLDDKNQIIMVNIGIYTVSKLSVKQYILPLSFQSTEIRKCEIVGFFFLVFRCCKYSMIS